MQQVLHSTAVKTMLLPACMVPGQRHNSVYVLFAPLLRVLRGGEQEQGERRVGRKRSLDGAAGRRRWGGGRGLGGGEAVICTTHGFGRCMAYPPLRMPRALAEVAGLRTWMPSAAPTVTTRSPALAAIILK